MSEVITNKKYLAAQSLLTYNICNSDRLHKIFNVELFRKQNGSLVCELALKENNVTFTVQEERDETGLMSVEMYRPKGTDCHGIGETHHTGHGVNAEVFHNMAAIACNQLGIIWQG